MWHSPQGTYRIVGERKCTHEKMQGRRDEFILGFFLRETSGGSEPWAAAFKVDVEMQRWGKWHSLHQFLVPLSSWPSRWPLVSLPPTITMALTSCTKGGQITLNFTFIQRCRHPVQKCPPPSCHDYRPILLHFLHSSHLALYYRVIVCLPWWNVKGQAFSLCLGQCWLRETVSIYILTK